VNRFASMFVLALAGASCASCALFRDACTQTAAARASAAVLLTDAQARLDEAAVVILALHPNCAEARDAFRAASEALNASRKMLSGVDDACAEVDIGLAFVAFKHAWELLEPFLVLLAGDGEPLVARPMVAR